MPLTLVIQAGGESRRMGQDKALLDFGGIPLIQRVYERLAPIADEVLVTSNRGGYDFLNAKTVADVIPGRGALGGLYTALVSAGHPLVAVVACDMPYASAGLFTYQRRLLENSAFDVAIPVSADGFEPFHAVYRKAACLPSLQAALDAEKWRIRPWIEGLRARQLSREETAPFDPTGGAFVNLNTPGDLLSG